MRRSLGLALVSLALLAPRAAFAAEQELANDSGAPVGFVGGFLAGEVAAARLIPDSVPVTLDRVRLVFGGAAGERDVTLRIWDDSAEQTAPGEELFAGTVALTASNDQIQEIDLSAAALVLRGPFRVGVEFTADGLPSVARDSDGTSHPARNLVLVQPLGWTTLSELGVAGDWVIRAVVVPEPGLGAAIAALVTLAALQRRRQVLST